MSDNKETGGRSYSFMRYGNHCMEPVGPIAILASQVEHSFSDKVNRRLVAKRTRYAEEIPELLEQRGFLREDYRKPVDLRRFGSGEGQATLKESIRGHDVFILTDVLNHGQSYRRFGEESKLSPDEYYNDLVRMIIAMHGIGKRINVIMPYLYEGRRYRRVNRGSLDCAQMLQHLFQLGISNFITFDAHDERIANAVPASNFESFTTSLQLMEALLEDYPDLRPEENYMMTVSPNEHTVNRCAYYANVLRIPMGIFYRKRDYASNRDLKVSMHFLGSGVRGKDILLVDDMLVTGSTLVKCAAYLKSKGARRVFAAVSFAQFTAGTKHIDTAFESGQIEKIFTTNLSYIAPGPASSPWLRIVDVTGYIAAIIDAVNHNSSLMGLLSPTGRIEELLAAHKSPNKSRR